MRDAAPVQILVDADACPVKEEIYKVAFRTETTVFIIANSYMRVPEHDLIKRIIVDGSFDAADDEIAERTTAHSIVVTSDIPLADRCLKAGAIVLRPNGDPFTADGIGAALATRAIMADLRAGGDQIGGPKPFSKADRSRFLQALDTSISKLRK